MNTMLKKLPTLKNKQLNDEASFLPSADGGAITSDEAKFDQLWKSSKGYKKGVRISQDYRDVVRPKKQVAKKKAWSPSDLWGGR
jgi:hypothetical protein